MSPLVPDVLGQFARPLPPLGGNAASCATLVSSFTQKNNLTDEKQRLIAYEEL